MIVAEKSTKHKKTCTMHLEEYIYQYFTRQSIKKICWKFASFNKIHDIQECGGTIECESCVSTIDKNSEGENHDNNRNRDTKHGE